MAGCRHYGEDHDIKDLDPTPRGNNDQWRFTPSMLDPNSFAFSNLANQPPGYYTPTPGGTNTLYHPQAGDLHTPGFTLGGLGTPLSMPNSEGALHTGTTPNLHPFQQSGLAPQVFQNPNPFGFQPPTVQHAQTFPPHQFSHQPGAFGGFAQQHHHHEQPKLEESMRHHDVEMTEQSPSIPFSQPPTFDNTMQHAPANPQMDK